MSVWFWVLSAIGAIGIAVLVFFWLRYETDPDNDESIFGNWDGDIR